MKHYTIFDCAMMNNNATRQQALGKIETEKGRVVEVT
jgi:hypothetical protein